MKKIILTIFVLIGTNALIKAQIISFGDTPLEELVYKYAPQIRHYSEENYHMASMDWYLPRAKIVEYVKGPGFFGHLTDRELNITESNIIDDKYADERFKITRKVSEAKYGDPRTAKTYVHVQKAHYQDKPYLNDDIDIQYWFFYPWNGDQGEDNIPFTDDADHEGDWENVTITVDGKGNLKRVFASSHGAGETYGPEGVSKVPGRDNIIIYAANESHAMYNDKGYNHPDAAFLDPCDDGGLWFSSWEPGRIEIVEIGNLYKGYQNYSPGTDAIDILHESFGQQETKPAWLNFIGRWGTNGVVGPKKNVAGWMGIKPERSHSSIYLALENSLFQPPRFHFYDYKRTDALPSFLIVGSGSICSSEYTTFSADIPENSEVLSWDINPKKMVRREDSGSDLKLKSNSRGTIKITAKIRTHYNGYFIDDIVSREVWVGAPHDMNGSMGGYVSGSITVSEGDIEKYYHINATIPGYAGTNDWSIPSSRFSANDWGYYSNAGAFINTIVGSNSGWVKVRRKNACGVSDYVSLYVTTDSGGGIGDGTYRISGELPIEEELNSMKLEGNETLVYPNPANNQVTVLIKDVSNDQPSTVQIINVNGQVVLSKPVSTSKTTLAISGLKKGVYFVKISNEEETTMKKLIVQD